MVWTGSNDKKYKYQVLMIINELLDMFFREKWDVYLFGAVSRGRYPFPSNIFTKVSTFVNSIKRVSRYEPTNSKSSVVFLLKNLTGLMPL